MSLLWVPVVIVAAMAQTMRNATQSSLTKTIGAAGATQVRFIYGLPFGCLFLLAVSLADGASPGLPVGRGWGFLLLGAVSQIVATALMLIAMRERGFALTTALIKTEPVLVAIAAYLILGDPLSAGKLTAIALACFGAWLLSFAKGAAKGGSFRPILIGIAAGGFFGLAAIGFRGAILSIPDAGYWMRAASIVAISLAVQSLIMGLYLALFDRRALLGSLKLWRQSLLAGFLGAFASLFWFLGFALTTTANVRTLALIEVPMAQVLSRRLFAERLSMRQMFGIGLMLLGVALLIGQS
jgi:drug/metabolite transporter (DMT)-like permease